MRSKLNRREFSKLTAAAMGGLVTGTTFSGTLFAADHDPKLLLSEKHVCRGLNICKGHGADKTNACAGQGACATIEKHTCKGANACKGQGGCGEHPGQNACKGKGGCHVPVKNEGAWKKARAAFEEQMKKEGKKVGPAPKPAK